MPVRRFRVAASTLVVGAAIAVGCGGVLGGAANQEFLTSFSPVACAIANGVAEDQNFVAAAGSGIRASREDDYAITASRQAIFDARLAELREAKATLDFLGVVTSDLTALVAAAKVDLADVTALITYDRTLPPDDAIEPPDVVPGALAAAIESQRQEVRTALTACTVPADLARRSALYNG